MFGQSASAPLFGAAAPASTGFGTGLFGSATPSAAPSAGTLFSSSPAPTIFGSTAPSAAGNLFGAPASSAPAAGSLFGAASSTSLFGTTAPAAASASLFGASAPPAGGLFGAKPANPPAGGLFGSSPSLFGAPAAASSSLFGASSASLFGAPPASSGAVVPFAGGGQVVPAPQQPAMQGNVEAAGLQQLQQEQQAMIRELRELDAAITPEQSTYKFTKLLLYVIEPGQRVRAKNVSNADWQHALRKAHGPANADGLWPVAVTGFQQLQAHKEGQDTAVFANRNYLSELRTSVQQICASHEHNLLQRVQKILKTQVTIAHRLLQVVRLVDALEARSSNSSHSSSANATLNDVSNKLFKVQAELAPNHVRGLKHRTEALAAAAELQANVMGTVASVPELCDGASLQRASNLIQDHNVAIHQLQKHLQLWSRDAAIMAATNEDISLIQTMES